MKPENFLQKINLSSLASKNLLDSKINSGSSEVKKSPISMMGDI